MYSCKMMQDSITILSCIDIIRARILFHSFLSSSTVAFMVILQSVFVKRMTKQHPATGNILLCEKFSIVEV